MSFDVDGIRSRRAFGVFGEPGSTVYEDVSALVAEVERLQAQVEAVKALHEPTSEVGDPPDWEYCQVCYALYPCPTVQALSVDNEETSEET